jgi:hypothetical protein
MAVTSRRRLKRDLISGRTAAGLGKAIEAELNERRVFKCGVDAGHKLGGRCPLDRDTQLSDAQARQNRSGAAGASIVVETVRGILFN